MIQRQQSLWLLLSAICSFLTFQFPFYNGTKLQNGLVASAEVDAGSTFFLLAFTGAALILALVTIFLFKDRKLQLRLCVVGIVITLLTLVFYFIEIRKFQPGGSISLWCLFAFANVIGFIMAARGVWKDEKLVKSLDKLR